MACMEKTTLAKLRWLIAVCAFCASGGIVVASHARGRMFPFRLPFVRETAATSGQILPHFAQRPQMYMEWADRPARYRSTVSQGIFPRVRRGYNISPGISGSGRMISRDKNNASTER